MIKSLWKSHWYTVRVLKKSDDQNFLDSLSVTVDGEIVTPEQMKKKIATPLAERRKHMQKAKREANALKNKQDIKRNDKLFERSTIFENNSSSSKEPENNKESPLISTIGKNLSKNAATKEATNSSSKKDSTLTQSPIPINDTGAGSSDVELSRVTNNSPVLKPKDRIFSDRKLSKYSSQKSIIVQPKQINRTIIFSSKGESSVGESSEGELSKEESDDSEEEIQVQQNKTKIDHRSSSKKDKSPKDDETHLNDEDGKNNAFTCICKQFPNVTQEDILRVSEFLQFLKFCNFLQNEIDIPGCQRSRIVDKKKNQTFGLMSSNCREILDMYQKKPREMARKIMKLVIPEEDLKNMTPTGKSVGDQHRSAIPENILQSVYRCLSENIQRSRYKLDYKTYRKVMTSMCATLRNPRSAVPTEKRKDFPDKDTFNSKKKKSKKD
ncbi:hypothetical protein TKK_0003027 [Trichogramma kaykai]